MFKTQCPDYVQVGFGDDIYYGSLHVYAIMHVLYMYEVLVISKII